MEINDLRIELLRDFLLFTKVFYKARTGREFIISQPISRESHYLTIANSLNDLFLGKIANLIIQVPPRYGKSEMLIHFCAWAIANYPDSNFLYVSYSHSLAKKQTQTIRQIISLPLFKKMFGVEISRESSAKDDFETNAGGSVYAAGVGGTITGRGAGIQNADRFGGCIVIDDAHKPDESTSETIREGTNTWFLNTLQSRVNSPTTPFVCIAQATHEADLPARLQQGLDWRNWTVVKIPALDACKNALDPSKHTAEVLLDMQEKMPYDFAAQYQQNPIPAGGGLFKKDWFVLLEEEPEIVATFITGDTAETSKTYNDPTVFSFWGVYKIKQFGKEINEYGLHWIDCMEEWLEPKDLINTFMAFYSECLNYPVKPSFVAIEKKSTGVALLSLLQGIQGIHLIDVPRTAASGSKTRRFLNCQPYVAKKLISLPAFGKHSQACIEHMSKITANESHRHDDRADTLADAIDMAFVKGMVTSTRTQIETYNETANKLSSLMNKQTHIKRSIYE